MLRHSAGAVLLAIALAAPARAQQPPADPQKPAAPADQKPATQPAPETQQTPEESPVYKEQVVVTASKTEQALVNAPATVSLISSQTIVNNGSTSYADLFRAVPGVNVTQTSARDINITSRGATNTLSTTAARAGRWPQHLSRLFWLRRLGLPAGGSRRNQADRSDPRPGVRDLGRQRDERRRQRDHEVAAGAAGVERHDRRGRLRARRRQQEEGAGALFYVNGSHAEAVNDRWAYKFSAGLYTQDPLARPSGAIPNGTARNTPPTPIRGRRSRRWTCVSTTTTPTASRS